MCRYAFSGPYKDHYACFRCRKAFKQTSRYEGVPHGGRPAPLRTVPCPDCGEPMHNMGLDFKAPPRADVKQWQKVERLHCNGFDFHSCGCSGPGDRPATLAEVDEFLARHDQRSEGERLAERFSQQPD